MMKTDLSRETRDAPAGSACPFLRAPLASCFAWLAGFGKFPMPAAHREESLSRRHVQDHKDQHKEMNTRVFCACRSNVANTHMFAAQIPPACEGHQPNRRRVGEDYDNPVRNAYETRLGPSCRPPGELAFSSSVSRLR